jgi:hypothetical protein
MITLNTPKTVSLFGKSRVITTVTLKQFSANNEINKVLATVENRIANKADFVWSEVLTLWSGVSPIEPIENDPKAGSYFEDRDTSDAGIEARIKQILG